MEQGSLLGDEGDEAVEDRRRAVRDARRAERAALNQQAEPRLAVAARSQIELRPVDVDSLIGPAHRARAIWSVVEQLELTGFYESIKARGSQAGRPCTDPKVLIALWLYATSKGVGSAHELDRLCREHDAYRWICGGVAMNYHTLSDFRTAHETPLDDLFTQLLAVMMKQGLVSLTRVAQDGTRVRASAGAGSFRRRKRLEEFEAAAREQVEAVKQQADTPSGGSERTARQRAAQERAARERAERVKQALAELAAIEAQRANESGGHKAKGEARASTTDSEARKMKMGDGGFRPAYNAQLATDTASRVIVGVAITEDGTDFAHAGPMIDQVNMRAGLTAEQWLLDAGYSSRDTVDAVTEKDVELYAPVPERKSNPDPYAIKPHDSEAVAAWKTRMQTEQAREIYKERGSTAELVNGDLKTWRTLDRFTVRGKRKVLCVLLWNALTYNALRYLTLMTSS
jgi:transposase